MLKRLAKKLQHLLIDEFGSAGCGPRSHEARDVIEDQAKALFACAKTSMDERRSRIYWRLYAIFRRLLCRGFIVCALSRMTSEIIS